MANELTIPSGSFLKVPCKHYLETMIRSYDVLRSELRKHLPFFIYWSDCIKTKPSASNAMRFAFTYFNKIDNDSIDEISEEKADDYLEALIKYYNIEFPDNVFGKHVAQFIRGFKSNTGRTEIKTDDFEWFPKDKKGNPLLPTEFEQISKEFDFAWKCARLWQLLEERKQEHYILNFFCIREIEFTKTSNIPSDTLSKLNESAIEEPGYLKKFVDFFTPEQMTKHDMCLLLKKACRASIMKQLNDGIKEIAPSNARIKPLDSLWLLARFYRIHNYRLDFIGQKMSVRAVKQFIGIDGDSPFLEWTPDNFEKQVQQGSVKVRKRTFPISEVLVTLYSHKDLLRFLDHKSNELIPGKERNPYKPLYDVISEQNSATLAISYLDLSSAKMREFVKEHFNIFKAIIFFGSIFNTRYEILVERYSHLLENNTTLAFFLVGAMIAEGLEHPKNLSFITVDDFDTWDIFLALLFWALMYTKAIEKKVEKQDTK